MTTGTEDKLLKVFTRALLNENEIFKKSRNGT